VAADSDIDAYLARLLSRLHDEFLLTRARRIDESDFEQGFLSGWRLAMRWAERLLRGGTAVAADYSEPKSLHFLDEALQATRRAPEPSAQTIGVLAGKRDWLKPPTDHQYPARFEAFLGFDPVELVVTLSEVDMVSFLDEVDAPRTRELRSVDGRIRGMSVVIQAQYSENG
jgi:hypothetical protein